MKIYNPPTLLSGSLKFLTTDGWYISTNLNILWNSVTCYFYILWQIEMSKIKKIINLHICYNLILVQRRQFTTKILNIYNIELCFQGHGGTREVPYPDNGLLSGCHGHFAHVRCHQLRIVQPPLLLAQKYWGGKLKLCWFGLWLD